MRRTLLFLAALPAFAHVGSPDVFLEGAAGPYQLFVTVRPPTVIPGVADIEIRSSTPGISRIRITPMPLTGEGSKYPPKPDEARRTKEDAQFFSGSLWIMATGSWQVRVEAEGSAGRGVLSVPVPAVATRTTTMDLTLGGTLFVLMMVLVAGIVSIIGAGVREAQLEPGAAPPAGNRRRARIAMAGSAVFVAALIYLGNSWWTAEAKAYSNNVYRPLNATVGVDGNRLTLRLANSTGSVRRRFDDFLADRKVDDFIPDHGHLMHLYVLRWPEMDRVWHLHPDMAGSGLFEQNLPAMPAGDYRLYGDVVHSSGFPETVVAELKTAGIVGAPLEGDDAAGAGPPVSEGPADTTAANLGDGWKMIWDRGNAPLKAGAAMLFRFHLEDAQGRRPSDMELYMGMPGHAAFVRTDGAVFAHVHPSGSVAMPALALANPGGSAPAGGSMANAAGGSMAGMDMAHMTMSGAISEVAFPYGFPQPGEYRIIIQMKRGGTVETGMFNALVSR